FLRQFDGLCRRQGDVFSAGAEGPFPLAVPDPHPLADARFRHAVTDLIDDAGTVALRDHAWPGDLARAALPRLHIGGVNAGGGELDAHFAGPRPRRLDIADA